MSKLITENDLKAIFDEILPICGRTVYRETVNKTISTAGIDSTPTKGASVTLPAGHVYLIVGQWTFNTGSSSATRNNQVVIRDVDASANKATQRILYPNQSFAVMQVTYITDYLTTPTEFAVCASSSMTYSSETPTVITAVSLC